MSFDIYHDGAETPCASFTVPGRAVSKSNYRFSRSEKSRREWARILQYQNDVGLSALAAGAKKHMGKPAHIKMLLVNQRLDVDNAAKAAVDGLKNVAFPDDNPKFLRSVLVAFSEDDGPIRTEFRIAWELSNPLPKAG